ncbi:actin binding Rho activating protein b [Aplochiton taeniatus]
MQLEGLQAPVSETQTERANQRKPSTNKNIKKLWTISMVCGLVKGWQQWVSENEDQQASVSTGWAPGGERRKPSAPKTSVNETRATATQESRDGSGALSVCCGETPLGSRVKPGQVGNTVTGSVQEEKSTGGVCFLTERMTEEALTGGEETDRMLSRRGLPTRRGRCSDTVSSPTRGWKEAEREERRATEGGPGEGGTWGVDTEDSGGPEAGGGQADRTEPPGGEEVHGSPAEGNTESAVRIKRPSTALVKRENMDAIKINALSKKYSAVGNLMGHWQSWTSEHTESQRLNPFSEDFDYEYSMSTRLRKGEEGYGRPKEGTKTAERAKRAEQHIHGEIDDMCYVIRIMADPDPDGKTRVTFGKLFERYVRISDKVVGILMRARKHGKVAFEGEMLWQGQDDAVVITLLV